ncbi:hypothetical protein BB561_005930 [Smittium simulii]|uniref:Phosphotyrosine protein phosphatase I domain-containing protein n=1 Tax=Smittium simulii TaxID=133385 RepID=A0A2T9Y7G4_9FUNG|nr:hypothetical protein BB561_005930 [Smittium simulii]
MQEKIKVLFVCLGNICRSPMSEAIFRDIVKKNKLEDRFEIDSAATSTYNIGSKPDSRSTATCNKYGIPVKHIARQVTKEDFLHFDYILGMDESNISNLMKIKPKNSKAIIKLLGDFDPKGDRIIQDPYYGNEDGFEYNFQQCMRSSQKLLDHILA